MQLLLLLSLFTVAAVAEPSDEIKEAVDYLHRSLPELKDPKKKWTDLWSPAVSALQQHPKYKQWLLEDEAKAAEASRQPLSTQRFLCSLPKSESTPTSVHRLRPADVKVVAALGDSLTAGNGAGATTIPGLLIQYRGYAWSIGGEVSLSRHTTLANILRHGNRNLVGFSTASGDINSAGAGLNVAEPGNEASDMPRQARSLVQKLRSSASVDFNNDWKVITLFIGGNDVCRYCRDKSLRSPARHVRNIRTALDYLHANVPRAFVNVVEVLDVSMVKQLVRDGSRTCKVLTANVLCACAARPENAAEDREIKQTIAAYQRQVGQLVASGRYDTRDDFTVVSHPFFRNSKPDTINGKVDLSLFAPDCFHFSVKGHAFAGKALWDSMLEPVGRKSSTWNPTGPFRCPTSRRPFFMTRKNS